MNKRRKELRKATERRKGLTEYTGAGREERCGGELEGRAEYN